MFINLSLLFPSLLLEDEQLWYLKLGKTENFVFKLLPILDSLHEYGKLIFIWYLDITFETETACIFI